jgi:preprotein translocase subunit YajC
MNAHPALVLAAVTSAGGGGLQDFLGGPMGTFVPIGGMFLLMYFLLIRPQQQRAKEHQKQIDAVKRGDMVVLSSGVIGKVVRVEEKEVGLEIAQNVTIKVVKAMIAEVRTRGEPAAANDAKS